MGIINNLLNSRTLRNAAQVKDGFNSYSNTQGNFTRDISKYLEMGVNKGGQFDNLYGDFNRIITTAPIFPLYYVDKDGKVDEESAIARYLDKPNDDYPQYKVLQQIYSEMLTSGYCDLFLWRKDGKNETEIFNLDKKYPEDNFRGITLVSGYDSSRLTKKQKDNIIRIQYGVSQSSSFMGYSPTQAAQSWRKMQDAMGLHTTAFARNAGMPIGQWVIIAPSVEEYVKIKNGLEDKIAGARNAGKQLFSWTPSGSTETQIKWVQFTSQDVQDYTAQLEFSEKKMSQSFGVPGTIKGTNDDASYATARVSEQVFIKYTIKPLIEDLKSQLIHAIERRFELSGEIKVNVIIPEIADESLVKIRATESQVKLFDSKIAAGYTPESIVMAYDLPESFLLLELQSEVSTASNKPVKAHNCHKGCTDKSHHHEIKNEMLRKYQSSLTPEEVESIESAFRKVTDEYTDLILKNGFIEKNIDEYKGNMSVVFSDQYTKLYDKALEDVAQSLVETLGVADVSLLNLTDEELELAVNQYRERVADFAVTFTEAVDKMPGATLQVRRAAAQPNIDRVVVSESEHTRVVSELRGWTKAEELFPVRVYKKWNALPDACPECLELADIEIDVTALFVGEKDNTDEIYRVVGGGLHPRCRCFCTYVMEGEQVRDND